MSFEGRWVYTSEGTGVCLKDHSDTLSKKGLVVLLGDEEHVGRANIKNVDIKYFMGPHKGYLNKPGRVWVDRKDKARDTIVLLEIQGGLLAVTQNTLEAYKAGKEALASFYYETDLDLTKNKNITSPLLENSGTTVWVLKEGKPVQVLLLAELADGGAIVKEGNKGRDYSRFYWSKPGNMPYGEEETIPILTAKNGLRLKPKCGNKNITNVTLNSVKKGHASLTLTMNVTNKEVFKGFVWENGDDIGKPCK